MLRFIILLFSLSLFTLSFAENPPSPTNIKRVIYITFDGTRWQDVFLNHSYFKIFWQKYADQVNFYGMPDTNKNMLVASIPISLPSYQSQMSGAIQPCSTNLCGRIPVQTFPEALKEKLNLAKHEVAVFGSWEEIGNAAEHIAGTIYTNVGNSPAYDPITQSADTAMYDLNMKQFSHLLDNKARPDEYTFAQAMHYFEIYKPRFLWIALNDSDAAAHRGNLDEYHQALMFYDYALDELFTKLKAMHLDQETMVIVTTDHGRGNGKLWTSHGPRIPESKQTWAFVMNGSLKPVSQSGDIFNYDTLSIRPTVEAAFGMM